MALLRKKLILTGRTASGKTTLKNALCRAWKLKPEISYTTRPIREGEVEDVDYYFISKSKFEEMISRKEMLEYDKFNGNYYGTSLQEFDDCDVMIMTPEGVKHASQVRQRMFNIYVFAEHKLILDRLANRYSIQVRADMRAIAERMSADDLQFWEYEQAKPYDIKLDSSLSLDLMLAQIKKYESQYK